MAQIDLPFGFNRIFKGPAIVDSVFTSTAELDAYLLSPVRYAGMVVALVEGGESTLWQLNATEDEWLAAGGGGSGSGGATGVETGCKMSATLGTDLISVDAGIYYIFDLVSNVFEKYEFLGATDVAVPSIGLRGVSYVYLDSSMNVVINAVAPTPAYRRQFAFLGKLIHETGVLEVVSNQTEVVANAANQFNDFLRGFRAINIEGNRVVPASTDLTLAFTGGELLSAGINDDVLNPNVKTFDPALLLSTRYRLRDSTQGPVTNSIDPTQVELAAGVLSAIAGGPNVATIQRVYLFPSGVIRIMYGQQTFLNPTIALQNLVSYTHEEEANIADNAVLICSIIIKHTCTDLTNTDDCKFILPDAFGRINSGAGGFSVSSLQDAYRNSVDPEITLEADTSKGLTIRNDLADTVRSMLSVENNAGTTKYLDVSPEAIIYTDVNGRKVLKNPKNELLHLDFKNVIENAGFDQTLIDVGTYTWSLISTGGRVSKNFMSMSAVDSTIGEGGIYTYSIPEWNEDWVNSTNQLEIVTRLVGGTAKFDVVIWASPDNVTYAEVMKTAHTAGILKLLFELPSDTRYFRVGFIYTSVDDATVLNLDRLSVIRDAFPVGQTMEVLNANYAYTSTLAGNILNFNTLINDDGILSKYLSYNSTTGVYTSKKAHSINIKIAINGTSSADVPIKHNGTTVTQLISQGAALASVFRADGGCNITMPVGDTLSFGGNVVGTVTTGGAANLAKVSLQAIAYADNVIVDAATSDYENIYSARIANNGTATITSQSSSFLGAVTRTGAGTTTLDISALGLTVAPSGCVTTSNATQFFASYSATPTLITVKTFLDNGVATDNNFSIVIQRQGTDYREFKKAPIFLNVSNERENNFLGSANRTTVNGPVILSENRLSYIASLTRTGLGIYAGVYKSGLFPIAPKSLATQGSAVSDQVTVSIRNETATGFTAYVVGVDGTPKDEAFNIFTVRSGSDYRPQDAFVANAVSITNHVTGGTEYETNETVDGDPVHARRYATTTTTATSFPYATLAAGLANVEFHAYILDNNNKWRCADVTDSGGNVQAWVTYDNVTGVLSMNLNAFTIKASRVTIKYTK